MFNESALMIVLIASSLIVNLITMILVIVLINKNKAHSIANENSASVPVNAANLTRSSTELGVVFCRNCGNQFDSSIKVCPNCKTQR